MLRRAADAHNLKLISEVMDISQIELIAKYCDIFQVGARNMQNYTLLRELGHARKPVLLKRGISATIEEWLLSAEYILAGGNNDVILCERGIRTFETATRNTFDISAIPVVKKLSHLPIVADPSHGAGRRDMVAQLARAAVAAGADGLIIEVHNDPDHALSDGAQSMFPAQFDRLMAELRIIAPAIGRSICLEPVAAADGRGRPRPTRTSDSQRSLGELGRVWAWGLDAGRLTMPPTLPSSSSDRRPRPDRRVDRSCRARALAVDTHRRRRSRSRCCAHALGGGAHRSRRASSVRRRSAPGPRRAGGARPAERRLCSRGRTHVSAPAAVITDVGGTKRDIVEAARALASAGDVRRRASARRRRARRLRVRHGRTCSRAGPGSSRRTRLDEADATPLARSVRGLVGAGSARTDAMAAAEHDRLMALI